MRLVLIVDDEAHVRRLVKIHLRNAGYSTLEAEDGEDVDRNEVVLTPKEYDLLLLLATLYIGFQQKTYLMFGNDSIVNELL